MSNYYKSRNEAIIKALRGALDRYPLYPGMPDQVKIYNEDMGLEFALKEMADWGVSWAKNNQSKAVTPATK